LPLSSTNTTPDRPVSRPPTAYTAALADLANFYFWQVEQGHQQAVDLIALEEANLLHARRLARTHHRWDQLIGTMQGLARLYVRRSRTAEWARLIDETTPDLTDPATNRPLPGRDDQWVILTGYRLRIAIDDRDWSAAARLLTLMIDHHRQAAATALAADPALLGDDERDRIRNLAIDYEQLGVVRYAQGQADCVHSYQQAADICRRIDDRLELANLAFHLGNAYLDIPELRDLDRAEHHYRESLTLRGEHDRFSCGAVSGQLGTVAWERLLDARASGAPATVLDAHLRTAAYHYHQAQALVPADALRERANIHNQLGLIYATGGQVEVAFTHYPKALNYAEMAGIRHLAGGIRGNIALRLAEAGRYSDAFAYARAALVDFVSYGPAAATDADRVRQLIAKIEQAAAEPSRGGGGVSDGAEGFGG
jgi:tetratricopeptide (TPR) repeat protein